MDSTEGQLPAESTTFETGSEQFVVDLIKLKSGEMKWVKVDGFSWYSEIDSMSFSNGSKETTTIVWTN